MRAEIWGETRPEYSSFTTVGQNDDIFAGKKAKLETGLETRLNSLVKHSYKISVRPAYVNLNAIFSNRETIGCNHFSSFQPSKGFLFNVSSKFELA